MRFSLLPAAAASTPPPAAQPTAPAVDSATADGADMPTDTAPAATATPPAEPVAVEAPAEPEAHYDAVLTYFPGYVANVSPTPYVRAPC